MCLGIADLRFQSRIYHGVATPETPSVRNIESPIENMLYAHTVFMVCGTIAQDYCVLISCKILPLLSRHQC